MTRAVWVLLVMTSVAEAQPEPAEPVPAEAPTEERDDGAIKPPAPEPEPAPAPKKAKEKKQDKADKPTKKDKPKQPEWPIDGLTMGGRVFVRETFESVDGGPTVGAMTLESVRLNATYEKKRVRAVVKAELSSGTAKLRDAFVQIRASRQLSVRAGRFKLPASTIETDSRWSLPTVDRGFLSDVYDDGLVLAGRRVGAIAIYKAPLRFSPKLEAGAFQTLTIDGDPQPGTFDQRYGLLGIARGSLRPTPSLEVDAWGSSRLARDGTSAVPSRQWATGADATLDLDDRGGPRGWFELALGSSALDATPASTSRVHFAAARAILSQRIGERTKHGWFVEPFVAGAAIDPDLDVDDDLVWDVSLGVNAGQWRRWRLQLQGDLRRAGAGRPTGLAGDADLRDRNALTLQLGAAF